MGLELYLDLLSQPCRSVYIFAKANSIQFDFKKVSLAEGQQYGEEFSKINLLRKVPAMKDGDFTLAESIAILLYLCRKYQTPDHWYPEDPLKRARVDEYLSWQHSAMRAHAAKIFWFRLMIPFITGEDVPTAKMDSAMEDLNNTLQLFEDKFLQDNPFIVGDEISLADVVAIVEIMQPLGSCLDVFEGRPKLAAWRDRVKDKIGPKLFDEAHKDILNAKNLPQTFEKNHMLDFLKPKIYKLFS
ncbi:glutathione S-transferase theta-3-like [Polypterus senegalus]|uniref:glutathione S-transferase theta-3-like n=1 Tax=Polypterus senegalus TaxID=55291 RepID=UPI001965AF3D|nr:glutathione S-transferase theta-3-like [Polypterus senegalus]